MQGAFFVQIGIYQKENSSWNRGFTKGTIYCIMNTWNGKQRKEKIYGRKRFRAASGAGGQQKHYKGGGQAVHHLVGPIQANPRHRTGAGGGATAVPSGYSVHPRGGGSSGPQPCGGTGNGADAQEPGCLTGRNLRNPERGLLRGFHHRLRGDGKTGSGLGNRAGDRAGRI